MSEPFRGLFVTGTDTGVGKTIVSAGLVSRLRRERPVRYWKPVQTGIEQDDDSATVQWLSGCSPRDIYNAGVRLPGPFSPHQSAKMAGVRIDLDDLLAHASAQPAAEAWVVEGAGGVLVPLNERDLMIDLMAALNVPVIVAARSALGTINHTLLTVRALRHRALTVAGVILVGTPNPENQAAIEHYGDVRILGLLPPLDPLNAATLESAVAAWELPLS